jgi:O-antigen biosynthesis protein
VYGEPVRFQFPVQHHGLMTPDQLSELYNRCVAGLVLSATNVSLVPQEMLAAGCIPVVNDAAQNHLVLDNDQVVYAPATPFDLADALSELVSQPSEVRTTRARGAAASVRSHQWAEAGREFEQIVRAVVTERSVT